MIYTVNLLFCTALIHEGLIQEVSGLHFITDLLVDCFKVKAVCTPESITQCLCPHLLEMSMSQGRELIFESERLLA